MLNDGVIAAVARRHLRAWRVREAEMLLEDWGMREPGSASLQALQGWLCLMMGRKEDGRLLVQNAVEAAPNCAFAYVAMGALHAAEGQRDEAELCWQRALVLDPADVDASALLVQSRRQAQDVVGAEQVARNAILAAPQDAMAHFVLAETLLGRPDGQEEALRLVARGVSLEPDEWRGWLVYGRALTHAGRLAEARARFERALLVRPAEPEALQALATACLQDAAWTEAERLAKKIVVLSPKQVQGYRILATAQAAQNRIDEAIGVLLQALRVTPGDLGALMDVAGLHRRAGRLDEAMTVARQAQALFPSIAAPAYLVAELDLYQGNTGDAFEALSRLELSKPEWLHTTRLPADAASINGRAVVLKGDSLSQVLLLARYAPRLAAMGADVYVSCTQAMQWGGLAGRLQGIRALIEQPTDVPESALVEPIICLPARFGIKEDEPLWQGAYLEVDAQHVEQVHAALADAPRPWVGIEFHGTMDAAVLAAVAGAVRAVGGTAVVLSPGIDPAIVGEPTIWPRLPDSYIFAVWVTALDTVIANDGITASIAGPLGKSAHILLGSDCDSLWGMGSDRTPWYPHLRLYRETHGAGWGEALTALHQAISPLACAASASQLETRTDHVY